MNLHITWPIHDPDATLHHCKTEALADLRHTLAMHGLTATSKPVIEITHGSKPAIAITINVRRHLAVVAA